MVTMLMRSVFDEISKSFIERDRTRSKGRHDAPGSSGPRAKR